MSFRNVWSDCLDKSLWMNWNFAFSLDLYSCWHSMAELGSTIESGILFLWNLWKIHRQWKYMSGLSENITVRTYEVGKMFNIHQRILKEVQFPKKIGNCGIFEGLSRCYIPLYWIERFPFQINWVQHRTGTF